MLSFIFLSLCSFSFFFLSSKSFIPLFLTSSHSLYGIGIGLSISCPNILILSSLVNNFFNSSFSNLYASSCVISLTSVSLLTNSSFIHFLASSLLIPFAYAVSCSLTKLLFNHLYLPSCSCISAIYPNGGLLITLLNIVGYNILFFSSFIYSIGILK